MSDFFSVSMKFLFIVFGCLIISCNETKSTREGNDTSEVQFNLPENFILEELYHISANKQGSWVALAEGQDNTIYACDQRGKIYFFKRFPMFWIKKSSYRFKTGR